MVGQNGGIRLLTFGEGLLRFAPTDDRHDAYHGKPSAASTVLRTVGGDELNVCVALARLGRDVAWASVLPTGSLGAVVRDCAAEAGVRMDYVVTHGGEEAEVGCFHVIPEENRVHYQRRHSAFCTQPAGLFDWSSALSERGEGAWLHLTGITPMLGTQPAASWAAAIDAAVAQGAPISVDLNFRPQLGSISKLWGFVNPKLASIDLLILSAHSVQALAAHLGVPDDASAAKKRRLDAGAILANAEDCEAVLPRLRALQEHLAGPALACCLKTRTGDKQSRWSVIVDADGVHTTEQTPTVHTPKDECGGGSAWAAGVIDTLSHKIRAAGKKKPERRDHHVVLGAEVARVASRRGDLLAALAQETIGDHSTASQADLDTIEARFVGSPALVEGLPDSSCKGAQHGSLQASSSRPPTSSALSARHQEPLARKRIHEALERLGNAKVIAILRAKNESRAVERCVELMNMGYRAIEVTCDSVGFAEGTLLPQVVSAVGSHCLVGVGTVTSLAQLELAAKGGAHFALSPVRPIESFGGEGFVQACHRMGVLAMPAAFTPQEIYECSELHGALCVKVFPAQLWSPATFQDLRKVGSFGRYQLCPSGGIDASTCEAWLKAGATAVGMGGCLVGKDVAVPPDDEKALAAAEADWKEKGRPGAVALAAKLGFVPRS